MQNQYPIKLSIAITTYNNEKYLSRALDSVFEQKHDYSFEIVITDNFSTDKTNEVIQKYYEKFPNIIHVIPTVKTAGISKNYLHTLRSCKGEYIATLDGDDYWTDSEKLARQITFLDNNPEFVLSCHRFKQRFEDTQLLTTDFIYPELFKGKPEGFEFGPEMYLKHWLTQSLTVVFRNSALNNTQQLDSYQYCWDTQILWNVLTKGKGYIHNFFGGVYSMPTKENWSEHDELKQAAIYYLIIAELLRDAPDNPHLRKTLDIYHNTLSSACTENTALLDISKVKNKDFTIVSDDDWGHEVYKAFGLQALTPFIGINIYNSDFIELISDFRYNMSQPLRFISSADSRHADNFKNTFGRSYPIARLGETIELHFTKYDSVDDAQEKWDDRIKRINWENVFFKMDASRENDNIEKIAAFNKLNIPCSNKACFLSSFHKKKVATMADSESIVLIDHWNPEAEILFPYSLNSFDLIGWLNGESGVYTKEKPFSRNIFRPTVEDRDHYFIQFNKSNSGLIAAYHFPESYIFNFDESKDNLVITYNKSADDYFYLETKESLYKRNLDLFIDLTCNDNRHIFILARCANKEHVLKVDFVCKDKYGVDTLIHSDDMNQQIPEEFEWIHFDFSMINAQGEDIKYLLSRVNGICFYINPDENANGTLEIIAIYLGSIAKFQEITNSQ